MNETYFAPYAWLPGGLARDVRMTVSNGRFDAVDAGRSAQSGDRTLGGLTLPGFANTHSHAFHRALRGRTHDNGGTFWTWRERMYAVAAVLDPDSYFALARATYAEMALAGVTSVGEFHYLHHAAGGASYADPNAMGAALAQAAAEAGIRITLLDTCYLVGGLGPDGPLPLGVQQQRFADRDAAAWATRLAAFETAPHVQIGAAIHSVRSVPRDQLPTVVAAARGTPLHVHVSEQPAENDQCRQAYGVTPTGLLAETGALGPFTTAVHATHLSSADIAEIGGSGTFTSICPSTERDLADGIGPARALKDAGSPITLGSDQHAVIDLLEEARALEMDERLASLRRGRFGIDELVAALTADGQRSLGWADAGRIEVGARADLTTVRLGTPRTAGSEPRQAILAATASDVDTVVVDGRVVVDAGRHLLGDVGRLLAAAIAPLWAE
ncbi:MAG: formimidoylglutamate deiminase [Pseudonocardiales bacterium]|nr:MAG: formimidoylglutamate deiminase [Pseudonocardiales bacterium]